MLQNLLFSFLFSALSEQATLERASVLHSEPPSLEVSSEACCKPEKDPFAIEPILAASSALAFDLDSDSILYAKNIHTPRPMGSIAKLMTAILILESHKLDEIVAIQRDSALIEGSKVWFYKNERLTAHDLLKGMLIHSGNDAAVALAIFDSGSEEEFVKKMNAKAIALGMSQTHFGNSSGFDTGNTSSTAYDILLMAKAALEHDAIQTIVATKYDEIRSVDGRIKHKLTTTNELLSNAHYAFKGIKTGTTPGAGPSFVGLAKLNGQTATDDVGHDILTIVLNSADRFQETKIILEWIKKSYSWPAAKQQ